MIQGARHSLCSERTRYLATHVLIQRNQVFVIWVDLRKSCCVCCRNICPVCRSVGLPIPLLHVDDDDGRSGWVAKSTVLYTDPQSIYTKFFVNDNNGSMVHVECELSTLTPEMKSLAHASHVDNCTLVVRENIVVKVVKPPQEIVHQTDSNDHAADFQVVNESTDHVTDHREGCFSVVSGIVPQRQDISAVPFVAKPPLFGRVRQLCESLVVLSVGFQFHMLDGHVLGNTTVE